MHNFYPDGSSICACQACSSIDRTLVSAESLSNGGYSSYVDYSEYFQSVIVSDTTKIGSMPGVGSSVTYGFMETIPIDYQGTNHANGFTPMYFEFRSVIRNAFDQIATVSGLEFTETSSELAEIRIGMNEQSSAGYAFYPSSFAWGSDIWINNAYAVVTGFSYQLALHEIGHSLGLSHTFDAVGGMTLPSDLDRTDVSVMSYNWASTTLGPVDIAALRLRTHN